MSGSYDESAGADDTMDSFWEVRTRPLTVSWHFQDTNTSDMAGFTIDLDSESGPRDT